MKIIHISTLFSPFVGGLEIAVQRVAEEQAKLGHEVYVVTSDAHSGDRPKFEKNLITIVRVKSWKNSYPYLIVPREMPREILKNADIIMGWGHTYYFIYKMVREAKKFEKPVGVYFIGVDYLRHHYNMLFRVFGYQYQRMLTKRLTKIIDIAFVTNDYEKELLKKRYGLESFVVPHGIDEKYLKTPNIAENFKEKYNIKDRIIAYIGRIHPTKGIDLLIRAFAKVAMKMPDTILIIAGSGDEKYIKKCLRLAERLGVRKRIKFIRYISEEDKIALIDASNVIVLPTKHAGESYPLLINEVLARGKKLIITRGSIASRWIEQLGIIRVVNGDPHEIGKAIINELIYNESTAKSKFRILTWREIAKKLLMIYEESLVRRTR